MKARLILTLLAACALPATVVGQPSESPRGPGGRPSKKGGAGAIALTPNQATAPAGFDVARNGIERGKVEKFEYESKATGEKFRATIYTPPGYSAANKYPVVYLLHGASGDETTWTNEIHAASILDNLYAAKKLAPMLVVMPSSLSVAARAKDLNRDDKARIGTAFGETLLHDLIPSIEAKFPVLVGREYRALAGLSAGARVALGTGLTNTDKFAWVGLFSGGNIRGLADDPKFDVTSPGRQLRLLWLSVGHRDEVVGPSMSAAGAFFTARKVPHLFRVNDGGHEPKVWMNDLYYFAPLLFRP